jgi:D-glycero-D-manno-heptose 1,7-bisphosphate phosphatase
VIANGYRLIIFDKDGTLAEGPEERRPPNTLAEQVVLPGVIEKCAVLRQRGVRLAIATNQGGVAFGYMSEGTAWDLLRTVAQRIDAEAWILCPHHPHGTIERYRGDCDCRKPRPGMLLDLMQYFDVPRGETLHVGDRDIDREAAARARCDFAWADAFFQR